MCLCLAKEDEVRLQESVLSNSGIDLDDVDMSSVNALYVDGAS